MSFALRPYQREAVDRAVTFLQSSTPGNAIVVMPTGSGKSLVIASIVQALDGPCIVFQPSKEILEQNAHKLRSYGYSPAIFSASIGRKEIGEITFATIGSVKNHPHLFEHMKYVLVDECHFVNSKGGMYKEFFQRLGNVKILGLTATPYRLTTDGFGGSILKFITRTNPCVFSRMIYYVQNETLFESGHLAKLEYFEIKGFNRNKLQTNSTGADYTDQSVQRHFKEIDFQGMLLKAVNRLREINRKGVLVFTRFIDEAAWLVERTSDSAIVTGETPKLERERILRDFKSGKIKVIANVGVLTTGFDYPELDTVVLARPTMSLALYYQMVGRAIRPHPDKPYSMIVDMVGLQSQFGRVEDLKIQGSHPKWCVATGMKQLTNVYFGEVFQRQDAPLTSWGGYARRNN